MKTQINLIDGTDVQLYTFIGCINEDAMKTLTIDGYLEGDTIIDFWNFCYDDLQKHFNKCISNGLAKYIFEGIGEIIEDYAKDYVKDVEEKWNRFNTTGSMK